MEDSGVEIREIAASGTHHSNPSNVGETRPSPPTSAPQSNRFYKTRRELPGAAPLSALPRLSNIKPNCTSSAALNKSAEAAAHQLNAAIDDVPPGTGSVARRRSADPNTQSATYPNISVGRLPSSDFSGSGPIPFSQRAPRTFAIDDDDDCYDSDQPRLRSLAPSSVGEATSQSRAGSLAQSSLDRSGFPVPPPVGGGGLATAKPSADPHPHSTEIPSYALLPESSVATVPQVRPVPRRAPPLPPPLVTSDLPPHAGLVTPSSTPSSLVGRNAPRVIPSSPSEVSSVNYMSSRDTSFDSLPPQPSPEPPVRQSLPSSYLSRNLSMNRQKTSPTGATQPPRPSPAPEAPQPPHFPLGSQATTPPVHDSAPAALRAQSEEVGSTTPGIENQPHRIGDHRRLTAPGGVIASHQTQPSWMPTHQGGSAFIAPPSTVMHRAATSSKNPLPMAPSLSVLAPQQDHIHVLPNSGWGSSYDQPNSSYLSSRTTMTSSPAVPPSTRQSHLDRDPPQHLRRFSSMQSPSSISVVSPSQEEEHSGLTPIPSPRFLDGSILVAQSSSNLVNRSHLSRSHLSAPPMDDDEKSGHSMLQNAPTREAIVSPSTPIRAPDTTTSVLLSPQFEDAHSDGVEKFILRSPEVADGSRGWRGGMPPPPIDEGINQDAFHAEPNDCGEELCNGVPSDGAASSPLQIDSHAGRPSSESSASVAALSDPSPATTTTTTNSTTLGGHAARAVEEEEGPEPPPASQPPFFERPPLLVTNQNCDAATPTASIEDGSKGGGGDATAVSIVVSAKSPEASIVRDGEFHPPNDATTSGIDLVPADSAAIAATVSNNEDEEEALERGLAEDEDAVHHPTRSTDVSLEGEDVMRRLLGLDEVVMGQKERGTPKRCQSPKRNQSGNSPNKKVPTADSTSAVSSKQSVRSGGSSSMGGGAPVARTRSQVLQEVLEEARRRVQRGVVDNNNANEVEDDAMSTCTNNNSVANISRHSSPSPLRIPEPSLGLRTGSSLHQHSNTNSSGLMSGQQHVSNHQRSSFLCNINASIFEDEIVGRAGGGSSGPLHHGGPGMDRLPKRPPSSFFAAPLHDTPAHRQLQQQRSRYLEYHDLTTNPDNVSSCVTLVGGSVTSTPFATRDHRVVPLFGRLEEERRELELLLARKQGDSCFTAAPVYEDPLFHSAAPFAFTAAAIKARQQFYGESPLAVAASFSSNSQPGAETQHRDAKKGNANVEEKASQQCISSPHTKTVSPTRHDTEKAKKEKRGGKKDKRSSSSRGASPDRKKDEAKADRKHRHKTHKERRDTGGRPTAAAKEAGKLRREKSPNFSSVNFANHTSTSTLQNNPYMNTRLTTKTEMFDDPSSFAQFHPDAIPAADAKYLGGSFGSIEATTPTDQATISDVAGASNDDVFDATYRGLDRLTPLVLSGSAASNQGVPRATPEGNGGNPQTNRNGNNNDGEVLNWLRTTSGIAGNSGRTRLDESGMLGSGDHHHNHQTSPSYEDDDVSDDHRDMVRSINNTESTRKAEKHRHYHRGGITEQARIAMEQTLAESAAKERQAALEKRTTPNATSSGTSPLALGASAISAASGVSPLLGTTVPRIGFDMKGAVIREVQRSGPAVGGGQGSLFSSVAVPVGLGMSSHHDVKPPQGAASKDSTPAAEANRTPSETATVAPTVHEKETAPSAAVVEDSVPDDVETKEKSAHQKENKDAPGEPSIGAPASTEGAPKYINPEGDKANETQPPKGSRARATNSATSSSSTRTSKTTRSDDETTSSDITSSSGDSSSASNDTTSTTGRRALGDTQTPTTLNPKGTTKTTEVKKGGGPSPQGRAVTAAQRSRSPSVVDTNGGRRVLALSKKTVMDVQSGKVTVEEATSSMPPAARKAAAAMLNALRNRQQQQRAVASTVPRGNHSRKGSDAHHKGAPYLLGDHPPPNNTASTRPQSRRSSSASIPAGATHPAAAGVAATLHHLHSPWAVLEERNSVSPIRRGSATASSVYAPTPAAARALRYSHAPSSMGSDLLSSRIPAQVVSPGCHRVDSKIPSYPHQQHPAPDGQYYLGAPALLVAPPYPSHLFHNGAPFVDLEHVLTMADPLVIADANEPDVEEALATAEIQKRELAEWRSLRSELEILGGIDDGAQSRRSSTSYLPLSRGSVSYAGSVLGDRPAGSVAGSVLLPPSPSIDTVMPARPAQPPQHPYFPHALDLTPLSRQRDEVQSADASRRIAEDGNTSLGGEGTKSGENKVVAAEVQKPITVVSPLSEPRNFVRHPPPQPNVPNMDRGTAAGDTAYRQQQLNGAAQRQREEQEERRRQEEREREEEAAHIPIALEWHSSSRGVVASPWHPAPSIKLEHEV